MKLLKGVALLLSLVIPLAPVRSEQPMLLFAAASLREVVDASTAAFSTKSGVHYEAVYAASSTLARQIEAGAPADVYLSANTAWMIYLDERGLVDHASITPIAGNRLVVIVPRQEQFIVDAVTLDALPDLLAGQVIAVADPAHVPAGIYAKQAMSALDIWSSVESLAVRAASVRDALAYVARGEVPYGLVYRSDALAEPRVRTLIELPAEMHDPIDYVAAVVTGSERPVLALEFLDFLVAADGQAIFAEHGFGPRPTER